MADNTIVDDIPEDEEEQSCEDEWKEREFHWFRRSFDAGYAP